MKPALILIAAFALIISSTTFADGGHNYPSGDIEKSSFAAQMTPDVDRTTTFAEKPPLQKIADDVHQEKIEGARAIPSIRALIHRGGP